MTTEKRTLVTVDDIIGFDFECSNCRTRLFLQLAKVDRKPHFCPNCNAEWFSQQGSTPARLSDVELIGEIAELLEDLRSRQPILKAIVRLEIKCD